MAAQSRVPYRAVAVLALLSLSLAAVPVAHAVVKNVQVVNSAGQPVASQTVTITFPDGTKKEEKTDDKGMLLFDFPGEGDYQISFDGGSMTVNVAGGVPTWGVALGAAAVVAGVAIAADDDDGDGGSPGGGGSGPLEGSCVLGGIVTTNPDGHPDNFTGASCNFTSTGTTATAVCTNTGLNVTLNGSVDTGAETFSLAGTGTYQGFTGTGFTFGGGYNPVSGVLAGSAAAGTNGNLPDSNMNSVNEPINYSFDCTLSN
jgi:hypothetical protein